MYSLQKTKGLFKKSLYMYFADLNLVFSVTVQCTVNDYGK